MDRHLLIFARQPRLGRVKTRLSRDIGALAAWRFYRACLDRITQRLEDPRWRCYLYVTPDQAAMAGQGWARHIKTSAWRRMAQGGGGLDQRLVRPLRNLPPGPVVMIGSDAPDVTARHIKMAFAMLGSRDVVFGPAKDGGFWLVGVRRRPRIPWLFNDVRWSSPDALADCLANLKGQKVGFVDSLEDVDDGESYRRCSFKRGINSTKLQGR